MSTVGVKGLTRGTAKRLACTCAPVSAVSMQISASQTDSNLLVFHLVGTITQQVANELRLGLEMGPLFSCL